MQPRLWPKAGDLALIDFQDCRQPLVKRVVMIAPREFLDLTDGSEVEGVFLFIKLNPLRQMSIKPQLIAGIHKVIAVIPSAEASKQERIAAILNRRNAKRSRTT